MRVAKSYEVLNEMMARRKKGLAVLIDPEKFKLQETRKFLNSIPKDTTHLFVGGSTMESGSMEDLISELKTNSSLPVIIFPGSHEQISEHADAILYLNLVSGRNPEYLIGQQVKAVSILRESKLEIISTAYLLIDGGNESAVARITETHPMSQENVSLIVDTAKAAEYMGSQLVYLEAGSGAINRVADNIISKVKNELAVPLIVGGGIRTEKERQLAYGAGADLVVMGTVFETNV